MDSARVAANLAAVRAHFHSEAADEVEHALDLYTDDITWESPARGVLIHGEEAIGANYRATFASMRDLVMRPLQQFATEDRAVDDSEATFILSGDGVRNAPVPVGKRVTMRILHIFEMRDARISRELVYELWNVAPV